ncbi:MAG TPA: hypothetical protein VMU80_26210 [Bryobacteraceae bacterium]|nr:hypothetical protein [Bryobacteraceae bacterium]HUO32735.1 hypothetical protein [Bryobacteraceae bacterium]
MRRRSLFWLSLSVLPGIAIWAQEGHPLTGSWHGEWHPSAGKKIPIFIYMKWNSKDIEGMINPGPKAVPLQVANLDASNWTVHLEAEAKDGKRIVIDGKLDQIGSYHRTITGTWTEGAMKGDFKLTRD